MQEIERLEQQAKQLRTEAEQKINKANDIDRKVADLKKALSAAQDVAKS